jgi:hypothetical protein
MTKWIILTLIIIFLLVLYLRKEIRKNTKLNKIQKEMNKPLIDSIQRESDYYK